MGDSSTKNRRLSLIGAEKIVVHLKILNTSYSKPTDRQTKMYRLFTHGYEHPKIRTLSKKAPEKIMLPLNVAKVEQANGQTDGQTDGWRKI